MERERRRVLVTGAAGFVGRHLCPALQKEGFDVIATSRSSGSDPGSKALDVTSGTEVRSVLADLRPVAVVHLAGMTYLPDVEADPSGSFAANVLGTLEMLEAVAAVAPKARVLVISSCSVYGSPDPRDLPLVEEAPLRAIHPYGVQKIGVEVIAQRFQRAGGLDVVVIRPFNHIGPGQDPRISLTHFAHQIAAAERGERPCVLRVGNLNVRRDFLDVRDVVRAYGLLLIHPDPPRLLNVASGRSLGIGEALDLMLRMSRLKFTIETDPSRLRKSDVPDLAGDASRLRRATGWQPRIPIEGALASVLDSARRPPGEVSA